MNLYNLLNEKFYIFFNNMKQINRKILCKKYNIIYTYINYARICLLWVYTINIQGIIYQIFKFNPREWFCETICQIIPCPNMQYINNILFFEIPDVVILDVNVLATFGEFSSACQCYCTLIVTPKFSWDKEYIVVMQTPK